MNDIVVFEEVGRVPRYGATLVPAELADWRAARFRKWQALRESPRD